MTIRATDREKLAAELDSLRREFRVISLCVWGVAVGVMIYGLGNVYGLLVDHQVPPEIAWILSPMVDLGLCVGLVGTRGLTRHGINAGWIGGLRWITGAMTWSLNIATPVTAPDGPDRLGIFIHSVGPVLLLVVVEGAAYYQHHMGKVIAEKQHRIDAAEHDTRAEHAERAEMAERLQRVTAEHAAAKAEAERSAKRLADIEAERSAGQDAALHAVRLAEQETERVRSASVEQAERLRSEHAERERQIRAEHAERLAALRGDPAARSERSTSSRSGSTTRPARSAEKTNAPKLTDEEAVGALLRAHPEQSYEWTSREVHRITGAGFGRIPKLTAMVAEHHGRSAKGTDRSTDEDDTKEAETVARPFASATA